jgi:hypothetical protein
MGTREDLMALRGTQKDTESFCQAAGKLRQELHPSIISDYKLSKNSEEGETRLWTL